MIRTLAPTAAPEMSLRLLGEFRLERRGRVIDVPHSAQRLVVFAAVHPHGVARSYAAATLWPGASETRAAGNLRSALWRLRQLGADITITDGMMIRLTPLLRVDLHEAVRTARACLDGQHSGEIEQWLNADLLPDWYDQWLMIERERLRQLRLHALEALADRLLADGATGRAIDLGLSAVAADPLRESAQRLIIEAHLADGNTGEALRQYTAFRRLLHAELGVPPSPRLDRIVAPYRRIRRPRSAAGSR